MANAPKLFTLIRALISRGSDIFLDFPYVYTYTNRFGSREMESAFFMFFFLFIEENEYML